MKESVNDGIFDSKLSASDWRYSAAIVGIIRYLKFFDFDFKIAAEKDEDGCELQYLYYKEEDVVGENAKPYFAEYAEDYFKQGMHHKKIEELLEKESLTEEDIKEINEKLSANSICKKIFGKIKYSEETKEQILELIEENRVTLILETFRYSISMYKKFANENRMLGEPDKVCRLNGYYVDLPKKSKSMAYNWNYDTYIAEDISEFDYIPFAFSKSRDSFFINNNYDLYTLISTNNKLKGCLEEAADDNKKYADPRCFMFMPLKKSEAFLNYEVEVIHIKQDEGYYKTLYVREPAIRILKAISEKQYMVLERPCRMGIGRYKQEGYYPVIEDITDHILNLVKIDDIIELMFHDEGNNHQFLIDVLIGINQIMYGGYDMYRKIREAKEAGMKAASKLREKKGENKIKSYQQKLISAITIRDYDRYCEIILQLSSYIEMPMDFAYELFSDFENNKNIAYAFAAGLSGKDNVPKEDNKEEK